MFDLATERGDVLLHDVAPGLVPVGPRMAKDLRPGDDLRRPGHEQLEDEELLGGQVDLETCVNVRRTKHGQGRSGLGTSTFLTKPHKADVDRRWDDLRATGDHRRDEKAAVDPTEHEHAGSRPPAKDQTDLPSTAGLIDNRCVRLTIIAPTRNELPNVRSFCERLALALEGREAWEVLFVDDSDDATPDVIARVAAEEPRIRLHHRPPGARDGGLGGAVQQGFSLTSGEVIVVMDADLQHPPEAVPRLIGALRTHHVDLVVGTRYPGRGPMTGLSGPWRRVVSTACRDLVHAAVPRSQLISDPLSGFFALRRGVVEDLPLQASGFKILLDVIAVGRWNASANVPYRFDPRRAGASKSTLREGWLLARRLLIIVGRTRRLAAPRLR